MTTLPTSDAKRHHLIPEAYMLRFSSDGRRVDVFDRITGRFRTDVPHNVAVESEFNTVNLMTGGKDRVAEARLAEIDSAAMLAFDKLESGDPLSRQERWNVSFFAGFAETRGRGFRDAITANMPLEEGARTGFIDDKFAEAFSAMKGVILDPHTIEKMVLEDMANIDPLTSGAYPIGAMVEGAFFLARCCFWSDWLVSTAPIGYEYITSDHPIGLLLPGGPIFGDDLVDPNVIRVLPLSRKNALVMRYAAQEDKPVARAVATPASLRVSNIGVARRCHRYVVGSADELRETVAVFKESAAPA